MVEAPKGKLNEPIDSKHSQDELIPIQEIKELVADINYLRLSFGVSFDLQVNRTNGRFETTISKGGGISSSNILEPVLAFGENSQKNHGGKYIDKKGRGNLELGDAVAIAYNVGRRKPVFMMRGIMGMDRANEPQRTTFVINFNNHESVQKLHQLISAVEDNPDYTARLFRQICEEATAGKFEKLLKLHEVKGAPFFIPIRLIGFKDIRKRNQNIPPKSLTRPDIPNSIPKEKNDNEKLSPSKDLVLLPNDDVVIQKIVGGDLKKSIYMDFPETQESPGNITILSTSGNYSLIRVTNNGIKTYRIVKGKFSKSEGFQPINTRDYEKIDINDSDFFTKIDGQTTLAVFSDFQGATYTEGEQIRPEVEGVYSVLNNSALDVLDGSDPYKISYAHYANSGHMNVLYDSLTNEQFNIITAGDKYAVGMTVGYNVFGQIVIQGTGRLSMDDGGRSFNKSAFVLVLNRTPETERLASFLISLDGDTKEKRWILGEIFETVDRNYPKKSRANHFFDQNNVDLMIVDRTKLPRAFLDVSQVIESGADLNEPKPPTFEITNLSEAIYATNDLIKLGLLGKVNVVFNGSNGSIDFSKLDPVLIQQLVEGFGKGNLEEYRRGNQKAETIDLFAREPSNEPITPTILRIKNIDENVLVLLTSLSLPETRTVGKDPHYFFDNEGLIYIPTVGSRFEVDFETNPQKFDHLQVRNIGINVGVSIPNKFNLPEKTTLIFKSSGTKVDSRKWIEHFSSIVDSDFKGIVIIDSSALQPSLSKTRLNLSKEIQPSFKVFIPDRKLAEEFKKNNKKITVIAPKESGQGNEYL